MSSSEQKIRKGDTVVLSSQGISQFPKLVLGKADRAIVIRVAKKGDMLYLQLENRKAPSYYHVSYWQVEQK